MLEPLQAAGCNGRIDCPWVSRRMHWRGFLRFLKVVNISLAFPPGPKSYRNVRNRNIGARSNCRFPSLGLCRYKCLRYSKPSRCTNRDTRTNKGQYSFQHRQTHEPTVQPGKLLKSSGLPVPNTPAISPSEQIAHDVSLIPVQWHQGSATLTRWTQKEAR
jgi:hypothetical protein